MKKRYVFAYTITSTNESDIMSITASSEEDARGTIQSHVAEVLVVSPSDVEIGELLRTAPLESDMNYLYANNHG